MVNGNIWISSYGMDDGNIFVVDMKSLCFIQTQVIYLLITDTTVTTTYTYSYLKIN